MVIWGNGGRVGLFRDVGNVTMDLNSIEHIQIHALGGADTITVNDLSGTGVTQVALDLASPAGSNTGDGQADSVIVNGTAGNDKITITSGGSAVLADWGAAHADISEARRGQHECSAHRPPRH